MCTETRGSASSIDLNRTVHKYVNGLISTKTQEVRNTLTDRSPGVLIQTTSTPTAQRQSPTLQCMVQHCATAGINCIDHTPQ